MDGFECGRYTPGGGARDTEGEMVYRWGRKKSIFCLYSSSHLSAL